MSVHRHIYLIKPLIDTGNRYGERTSPSSTPVQIMNSLLCRFFRQWPSDLRRQNSYDRVQRTLNTLVSDPTDRPLSFDRDAAANSPGEWTCSLFEFINGILQIVFSKIFFHILVSMENPKSRSLNES